MQTAQSYNYSYKVGLLSKAELREWYKFIYNNISYEKNTSFNVYYHAFCAKIELKTKNLVPVVEHGDVGVIIQECISIAECGKLVFIEGRVIHLMCLNILQQNLKVSTQKFDHKNSFKFSQEIDPKHAELNVLFGCLLTVPN